MKRTLPGFKRDIGAMNLNTLAGSLFYKDHAHALSRKGFEIITADYPNCTVTNEGDFLGISTSLDQNWSLLSDSPQRTPRPGSSGGQILRLIVLR
jgi:hypothetical protein